MSLFLKGVFLEKSTLILFWSFWLSIIIGLINLYSATHGVNLTFSVKFWKQIIWLSGGWFLFILCTFIDYNFFPSKCLFSVCLQSSLSCFGNVDWEIFFWGSALVGFRFFSFSTFRNNETGSYPCFSSDSLYL